MEQAHIGTISRKLKSVAHPVRLKVLCVLLEGEKSVGEIHKYFESSYSNISQHLQKLQNMGLLSSVKRANFIHYSLADSKVNELIQLLQKLYCPDSSTGKE